MTSKKLGIALISLLVLSILAVAPAMAAALGASVAPGETVFVGESGLSMTKMVTYGNVYHYAAGSTPGTDAPDVVMPLPTNATVAITTTYSTGAWFNTTAATTALFYVQQPSLALSVWNPDDNIEVSGKKLIDGQNVAIRVDTNLAALFSRASVTRATNSGIAPGIDVKVVTPDGATLKAVLNTSSFVTNLTGVQPTNTVYYLNTNGTIQTGTKASNSIWNFNTANYAAGEYQIYAEVNVNSLKDNLGSVTGKTVSNTATISLDKEVITITADKETVVRNNDFTVTLDGAPKAYYYVWMSGTNSYSNSTNYAPRFTPNQVDVSFLGSANLTAQYKTSTAVSSDVKENFTDASGNMYNAWSVLARTSSSGTITIGVTTDSNTKDAVYTIRVQKVTSVALNTLNSQLYDTVKVKVEKGAVTVTASGDGSYYLGEEVVLSGTNTDTDNTYMFITGPNLPVNGGMLTAPQTAIVVGSVNLSETVKTDDTWSYKWDTSSLALDAGTYTIYASSKEVLKSGLSNAKYDTVSIVVKKPFVTATTSASTVAKGDKLYIRGTAEGNPTEGVGIWILGKNYWNGGYGITDYTAMTMVTETVNDDGSFEYEMGTAATKDLASGQYFVVVQHPMYNNKFDVIAVKEAGANRIIVQENIESLTTPLTNTRFLIWGDGKLQGSDAAEALITSINSPDIDDTYTKLTFLIEEPWIRINSIGDHYVGDVFKISGTTNLAVGDDLIVEVTSSSFAPTQKTQSGEFSGVSETVKVVEGDSYNEWSMDVDASTFKPDEYIVNVEAIEATATATTTFNVLKGTAPTTGPTTPTSGPTTAPTTGPTTVQTPEPTASPGFGAFVALIGLGAVAALVMRKD